MEALVRDRGMRRDRGRRARRIRIAVVGWSPRPGFGATVARTAAASPGNWSVLAIIGCAFASWFVVSRDVHKWQTAASNVAADPIAPA
jgi:hypothetical protein